LEKLSFQLDPKIEVPKTANKLPKIENIRGYCLDAVETKGIDSVLTVYIEKYPTQIERIAKTIKEKLRPKLLSSASFSTIKLLFLADKRPTQINLKEYEAVNNADKRANQ